MITIDYFTVVLGVIVVRGWSDGAVPEVLYDGRTLPTSQARVPRQDLVAAFGADALMWGFISSAVPAVENIEHDKLRLRMEDGRLASPSALATPEARQSNQLFNRFRREVAAAPGSLLEIGSRARSGNTYREMFAGGVEYVGTDITEGPNVDVIADAHHLTRSFSRRFDYVLSISVFEHLIMPWKAALEMNAVMNHGALAYIQSHHGWPLHEEPWDFWRFSANSWNGLFNKHTGYEVVDSGYDISGMIVPAFAQGGPLQNIDLQKTHMLSACIVRKIADPRIVWPLEVAEIYDLGYSHR